MLDAKARYVAMVAEIENCNFQNFFRVAGYCYICLMNFRKFFSYIDTVYN